MLGGCLFAVLLAFAGVARAAPVKNGFDLAGASVPASSILSGGPPRDGIPAIDNPKFESAAEAEWLVDSSRVIGVEIDGEAKAYPVAVLNWHEIVNDTLAGRRLAVTFCPLCGTGVVFAAEDDDEEGFGVSGLLYNSDVLLYDRRTQSLWSQILAEAVSGARNGEKLLIVPSLHTSWSGWRKMHPDTKVLSRDTGHARDYGTDPYFGYDRTPAVFFPVEHADRGARDPKQRVLGLVAGGSAKAFPLEELAAAGKASFADQVGGVAVVIRYDAHGNAAWAESPAGDRLATVTAFWFAWFAFHPATEVFSN